MIGIYLNCHYFEICLFGFGFGSFFYKITPITKLAMMIECKCDLDHQGQI
jgi:hypothetical protein